MNRNTNRFAAVNSVFLIPQADGKWTACVSSYKPDPQALKLCKEKKYPVSLFYCRYDINGSSVYEEDICKNRDELLTSLNWSGQCGHTIRHLWDFKFEENRDPAITELLHDSILINPNEQEIFELASVSCALSLVANEEDIPLLARKILDAQLTSPATFNLGKGVDAVCTLLEFGMNSNRFPEFPTATPRQMRDILLSCDLDIFKEIVDSVAKDIQAYNAPDNEYSDAAAQSRAAAVEYITNATQKKTPLADQISDANFRADTSGIGAKEKEGQFLSDSR